MPIDRDHFRAKLSDMRVELENLNKTSADDRSAVTLDQQSVGRLSRMDALQQQAMAKAQERRRRQEIARVDAALQRISAGEFGFCLDCDEEIASKRLEIDPAATLCVKCAGS